MNAYSEKKYRDEKGNVDLDVSKPLILSMLDNRFWHLQESIGQAWSIGKPLGEGDL